MNTALLLIQALGLIAVLAFVAFTAGYAVRLAQEEWFTRPDTPWLQYAVSGVTFVLLIAIILSPVPEPASLPSPQIAAAPDRPKPVPEPESELEKTAEQPIPPEASETTEPVAAEPAPAGPELWHVTGNVVNVRSGPGLTYTVIGQVSRYDTLEATGPLNRGWLPIANDRVRGYVAFDFLAYGSGEDAYLRRCRASVGARPPNGTIVTQSSPGPHRVLFRNTMDNDVIVKLANVFGVTAITVYLHAGGEAQVNSVADGVFRVFAAKGNDFSQGCGVFVNEFEARRSEREWAFEPSRSGNVRQDYSSYTINAASLFTGVDRTRDVGVTEFSRR